MAYRDEDKWADAPNIADMTREAIAAVHKNGKKQGFFLMVEGGMIDKAHHNNMGARSVDEMVQFDGAVGVVMDYLKNNNILDETLVIVTADHGHSFTFSDPGKRGINVTDPITHVRNIQGRADKTTAAGYYTGPGKTTNACA